MVLVLVEMLVVVVVVVEVVVVVMVVVVAVAGQERGGMAAVTENCWRSNSGNIKNNSCSGCPLSSCTGRLAPSFTPTTFAAAAAAAVAAEFMVVGMKLMSTALPVVAAFVSVVVAEAVSRWAGKWGR